jgi:hypothetical protein
MPAAPKNLRLPHIDPRAEFEQAEGQLREYFLARKDRETAVIRRFREAMATNARTQPALDAEATVEVDTEQRR